jgi:hypothetical protein
MDAAIGWGSKSINWAVYNMSGVCAILQNGQEIVADVHKHIMAIVMCAWGAAESVVFELFCAVWSGQSQQYNPTAK